MYKKLFLTIPYPMNANTLVLNEHNYVLYAQQTYDCQTSVYSRLLHHGHAQYQTKCIIVYVGPLLVMLELVTLELCRCGVCHLVLSYLQTVHLSGANFNCQVFVQLVSLPIVFIKSSIF